ncbi:MAG: succinate dehydrogenase hydrophobic membrane anchor subunit [Thermomicrobium sp.]|nr:succinate dehydrogenase hydrophobic membrane anchor subunit [Thermomicrobium sp.]MDW8006928.1 succinate dehydrogenase hydrophobic membrane anchor subunit [Thermomicrobium sp.]
MTSVRPHVGRERPAGGFELYSWYFFRLSGLLLIFLAIGHVVIMHVINTVDEIDWQFVADRWHSPFWRAYDWLMLFLALLHGLNGARLAVDDYIRPQGWRVLAHSILWTLAIVFLIIGSIAILTFDPARFQAVAQAGG